MNKKLIIFSAPSGSGKSTIIRHLLERFPRLEFSVSCTSRKSRWNEQHSVDYYFVTPDEFRQQIENQEFIEFEEVYADLYYGTPKSEIARINAKGNIIVFDVDVMGGMNIKNQFGKCALSVFIAPPSVEELRRRLTCRATDSPEMIDLRMNRAEYEMSFADKFDVVIVNDNLEKAIAEAETEIKRFLE
jgi:guanylate kinase